MSIKIAFRYRATAGRVVRSGFEQSFGRGCPVRRMVIFLSLVTGMLFLTCPTITVAELHIKREVVKRPEQLPRGVRRMYEALMQAVRSGEIEQMREVLQLNELMPLVDGQFFHDPVAQWKKTSVDHSGRDVLARFSEILELPPVKLMRGKDISYIWPWFAGVSLDRLSPSQLVQLYRLAPARRIAMMLKEKRYSGPWLRMGPDGTWHDFGTSYGK